jgi:hypothetical protein
VGGGGGGGAWSGLLGDTTHDLRVQPGSGIPAAARAAIVPVTQPAEDDPDQVEVAFGRGPSALRPLDALTPVARDVREQ